MTDIMANLFIDVHLSKAKLSLILDSICFLIVSNVGEYSLGQMMLMLLADGSTGLLRNALYDHRSPWFHLAFHWLWVETNPNMS